MRQGERRDEPACDPVGDSQDQPADGRGIWSGDVDKLERLLQMFRGDTREGRASALHFSAGCMACLPDIARGAK